MSGRIGVTRTPPARDSCRLGGRLHAAAIGASCVVAIVLALATDSALIAGHRRSAPPRPFEMGSTHAQAASSGSIGAGNSAFRARRRGDSYQLSGGGVTADVHSGLVALHAGSGLARMSVAGLGRDGHVQSVGGLVTRVAANRVDLVHDDLDEWYVAGPLGIEQGFTVGHRPQGGGPLSLAINLSGSLRPELTRSGVLFAGRGRARFRYGNPVALDDRGRRLPATVRLAKGSLVLHVDDRRARYPVRIDPLIQQGAKA